MAFKATKPQLAEKKQRLFCRFKKITNFEANYTSIQLILYSLLFIFLLIAHEKNYSSRCYCSIGNDRIRTKQ